MKRERLFYISRGMFVNSKVQCLCELNKEFLYNSYILGLLSDTTKYSKHLAC